MILFTEIQQEGDAAKQHTVVPRDKNSLLIKAALSHSTFDLGRQTPTDLQENGIG
jgi:hypothetical protein